MAYKNFYRQDPKVGLGWQLRISIDYNVLLKTNPDNKIKDISDILEEVIKNRLDSKLYVIENKDELKQGYDGAIDESGKDRTQFGKEVCIYFHESDLVEWTSDKIKTLICELWKKLEEKNIPLVYLEIPGDEKIKGPYKLPTPFSFTCDTQFREEDGIKIYDWLEPHGILFKKFKGDGTQHPLLNVRLNEADMLAAGFNFKPSLEYAKNHLENIIKMFESDWARVPELQIKEQLFNEKFIDGIWEVIKEYQDVFNSDNRIEDKISAQNKFKEKYKEYDEFFSNFPRQNDGDFSRVFQIDFLGKNQDNIQKEAFDDVIQKLREAFPQMIQKIAEDLDLPKEKIEKNPVRYQTLFRRKMLIVSEKEGFNSFKNALLAYNEKVNQKVNDVINKSLLGINEYKELPRGLFNSHLSIFSRIFDRDRGLKRSQFYLDLLSANANNKEKIKVLFALFNSKDGVTLQKEVAKAIFGKDNITEARIKIRSLATQLHDQGFTPKKLNGEIFSDLKKIQVLANTKADAEIIRNNFVI